MRLKLDFRGDTIVEVMVVLAVLGMAIGICYATSNRSLLNARQAQENSEATEALLQQIEYLRTMTGDSGTNNIFVTSPSFCIYNNSGTLTRSNLIGPPSDPTYHSYTGTQCVNSFYHIAVTYQPTIDPNNDTFMVQAFWDDVLGQGQDTVTMFYRVHS